MGQKGKRSINYYMRLLHRDVGFFVIGLTIIYSISGIVLIYRDTDFLKNKELIEMKLPPNLEETELAKALYIWDLKILKTKGNTVFFKDGAYNKTTGVAKYTSQELPDWLNKFNNLHQSSSESRVHWCTTIFGLLLLFLAISSFWMFKPKTKLFRRGIYLAIAGTAFAIVLLLI